MAVRKMIGARSAQLTNSHSFGTFVSWVAKARWALVLVYLRPSRPAFAVLNG